MGQQKRSFMPAEGFIPKPVSVAAAGGLVTNKPPHLVGPAGNVYGGGANLVEINGSMASIPTYTVIAGNAGLVLGNPAGVNGTDRWDWAYNSNYINYLYELNGGAYIADGDPIYGGGLLGFETFNKAGGSTVTLTTGSNVLVGLATTWTTDQLTGPYTYTPSLNVISPGDIIAVTLAAGVRYYKVIGVSSNTSMQIAPTPTDTTQAGCAYTVYRGGLGVSNSRVVVLYDTFNNPYFYYCGGNALMCFSPNTAIKHFMGPQFTPPTGGLFATDIIYYKSYLLYGSGQTIGFSQTGFPGASFPFDLGTPNLTASNIAVITPGDDRFISFEFLGDQPVAVFYKSLWLVQQTGATPPFAFYRLPEVVGADAQPKQPQLSIPVLYKGPNGVQPYNGNRPSATARGAVYYLASQGLMEFTGGVSVSVSQPVDDQMPTLANVHWDKVLDAVIVDGWPFNNSGFGIQNSTGNQLVFQRVLRNWTSIDGVAGFSPNRVLPEGMHNVIGATPTTGLLRRLRHISYTLANGQIAMDYGPNSNPIDKHIYAGLASQIWRWLSPVIPVGIEYADFVWDGFLPDANTYDGNTTPITWALSSGSTPYQMNLRTQGNYLLNTPTGLTRSARLSVGAKIDDAYIQLYLQGTTAANVAGVVIFDAATHARR